MRSLYELISKYWPVRKKSSRTSLEDEDATESTDKPEEDPYPDPDLAEKLGMSIVAQPVEVCPESQVPPDSMCPPEAEPVDQAPGPAGSKDQQAFEVPTLVIEDSQGEATGESADVGTGPGSPEIGSPKIAPTEMDPGTPSLPDTLKATWENESLPSPPSVPETSHEIEKGKGEDLNDVQRKIQELRLDMEK